jgi:polar amino acid transport system substrate-binding protein
MKNNLIKLILILSIALCAITSPANPATQVKSPYRIGVLLAPPFTFYKNNHYSGISYDIWKEIAEEAHFSYKVVKHFTNATSAIDQLKNGNLDAIIGPISVVSSRIPDADFSRPYYISVLGIATQKKTATFLNTLEYMLSSNIGFYILITLVVSMVLAIATYTFKRRHHKKLLMQDENTQPLGTFWGIFIDSIIHFMTTTPVKTKNTALRIIQFISMIFSIFFISIFVGIVTSSLTISQSNLTLNRVNTDKYNIFRYKKVAVVEGSYSQLFLSQLGANYIAAHNYIDAINLLVKHKVSYVVSDYPTLNEHIRALPHDKLQLLSIALGRNELAFAFPKNSQLRDTIDIALLKLQEKNDLVGICHKYTENKVILEGCQI